MNKKSLPRRFVEADLTWLISNPTKEARAGLTAYRQDCGVRELFSIYVHFLQSKELGAIWDKAKIFALAEEMESRLPPIGGVLVITSGGTSVAEARIVSVGSERI